MESLVDELDLEFFLTMTVPFPLDVDRTCPLERQVGIIVAVDAESIGNVLPDGELKGSTCCGSVITGPRRVQLVQPPP